MFTREQLEDIMNNKPFGFGKEILRGKKKRFAFVAKPYNKSYLESVEVEVFCERESQAFDKAKMQYYTMGIVSDGVDWAKAPK